MLSPKDQERLRVLEENTARTPEEETEYQKLVQKRDVPVK